VLLVVQIALGGWVSTNYAVLACTDFPTCNGQWIPPMDFGHGFHLWRALGMTKDGDAITQDALVAIHWTHRTFAFVVVAYLVAFALKMRRFESLRRPANGVLLVVLLQFLTGLTNIAAVAAAGRRRAQRRRRDPAAARRHVKLSHPFKPPRPCRAARARRRPGVTAHAKHPLPIAR
jgi:hypothetical protein